MNAVFDTKTNIVIGDKGHLRFGRWQLVAAPLYKAADTFNRVLASHVSRRGDIAEIPLCKRCRKDRAAATEFKVVRRREVNQLPRRLIEEDKEGVNLWPEDVRDSTFRFGPKRESIA
jgi:hypothetical protein